MTIYYNTVYVQKGMGRVDHKITTSNEHKEGTRAGEVLINVK
jgi:hypothetical protein